MKIVTEIFMVKGGAQKYFETNFFKTGDLGISSSRTMFTALGIIMLKLAFWWALQLHGEYFYRQYVVCSDATFHFC